MNFENNNNGGMLMDFIRYRKYPRVYDSKNRNRNKTIFNISTCSAAGILAFVFLKGMFWGYILKKYRR